MKCPICNQTMQKYEAYLDTILIEYEYKCLGHYEEYFDAGNYRIVIGNTAFEWTYKQEQPIEEIHRAIENADRS